MKMLLPFWQRLLITLMAMLAVSYVASVMWLSVLDWPIPGYISGVIGGVTALPVWEMLKRIRPKQR
ncbi:MAG: hypothetical protein ABJL55_23510 [Roseibium sp.]